MTDTIVHCSFCSKHKNQVVKLIVSHKVAICNECVDLCESLLRQQDNSKQITNKLQIPDPLDIKQYLDQQVIGQEQAKIVLSVAIANHYKRINSPNSIQKSNILMIGSTGTGKTTIISEVIKKMIEKDNNKL
jgi:ATP-dependent Clp protease ATP-binding subunit ClpX